ncbi:hypothetical protein SO694_00156012 [Aureococcus anophagefferens]|uniref:Uncharacterized protein n=1 Tax=Aureococcus anophagefferens TaxID=44056 RepID=A0ABR1G0P5_AURAN
MGAGRFDEEDDDEDPLASGGWSRPRPPRDDDDDDDDGHDASQLVRISSSLILDDGCRGLRDVARRAARRRRRRRRPSAAGRPGRVDEALLVDAEAAVAAAAAVLAADGRGAPAVGGGAPFRAPGGALEPMRAREPRGRDAARAAAAMESPVVGALEFGEVVDVAGHAESSCGGVAEVPGRGWASAKLLLPAGAAGAARAAEADAWRRALRLLAAAARRPAARPPSPAAKRATFDCTSAARDDATVAGLEGLCLGVAALPGSAAAPGAAAADATLAASLRVFAVRDAEAAVASAPREGPPGARVRAPGRWGARRDLAGRAARRARRETTADLGDRAVKHSVVCAGLGAFATARVPATRSSAPARDSGPTSARARRAALAGPPGRAPGAWRARAPARTPAASTAAARPRAPRSAGAPPRTGGRVPRRSTATSSSTRRGQRASRGS